MSALFVTVLAGSVFLLWPQLSDSRTAAAAITGVVVAVGGVLSGLAGTVAAVAAYAVARESRQPAVHAREALGLAIEPELQIRPLVHYYYPSGNRLVATITNDSRWGTMDVMLEVRCTTSVG